MKIVKLQAENFKKLKAIEIIPHNRIVEITGKCEQGKTTVLDAIQAALCGHKPEDPVREGQDKGKVVVDLDDKIVTRTFTKAGGGTLKVESKDGARYPSPQALLDKLVGKIAFNPLEFARADNKKQVDMLLQVVNLKVDPAKLKEISGVEIAKTPNPLDMLNAAYKSVYEDRTITNRQLDAAKKVLDSMPDVLKTEPVSITELVTEKEKLEAIEQKNASKRNDVELQRSFVREKDEIRDGIAKEIEILEKQLVAKREALKIATNVVIESEKELSRMEEESAKLIDPDFTEINTKIANADKTNQQAKQYQDRQAKQKEVDKLQSDSDNQTAKLKKIIDYKQEIIKNTKFPVPGLDFANGGITFNGHPFSQASSAQKIRVGMSVGMAANPALRVVMIDGYESLDRDQRKIVEDMATEYDFQIWTTTISDDGKVGIYIEDGEIKNARD